MLSITVSDDGSLYTLNEDAVIRGYEIPKGFSWDGASVPWFATRIVPRAYKMLEVSCLHDWMCRNAKSKEERKLADEKLRSGMMAKGFSFFRSTCGYYGVRIGAFLGIGVHYPHWTDKLNRA